MLKFPLIDRDAILLCAVLLRGFCAASAGAAVPETPRIVDVEVIDDHRVGDPAIIWADDFEDTDSLYDDYHDVSNNGGRFDLSGLDALGGSARSVRQLYDPGQVNAGWMWYFFGDHPSFGGGTRQTDIHVRWYHKFEEGFQGHPPKMERLGGFAYTDWTLSFMAHHWISPSTGRIISVPASNIAVGDSGQGPPSCAPARTWLLSRGWRWCGLLSLDEVPG